MAASSHLSGPSAPAAANLTGKGCHSAASTAGGKDQLGGRATEGPDVFIEFEEEPESCAVCYDEFVDDEIIKQLPCGELKTS